MADYQRYSNTGRPSLLTPMIKTIAIINVVMFIAQNLFFPFYTIGGISIDNYLALQPLDAHRGVGFYIWQLLTYQFMHADMWHIFMNLFALWMFGIEIENEFGSRKFIIFYLLSGIGAGLTQLCIPLIFNWYPAVPTIGASGAVYGVLLAFGLLFPKRPIFMFPIFIPIPARIFVLLYAAFELYSGFQGADGVAHFAHLGGALTGFLLIKFGDKLGVYRLFDKLIGLFSKKDENSRQRSYKNPYEEAPIYQTKWHQTETHQHDTSVKYTTNPQPKNPFYVGGEEITQVRVDEILDKISASGYQNLTEKEKKILFELSQKLK